MSTVLKGITLADYEARERVAELKSDFYRGEGILEILGPPTF